MKGKGNDGKGNIPERDLWQTKQSFWLKLHKQYNFTFDCCANESNTKCIYFSNDFSSYNDRVSVGWMNPPFSLAAEMFEQFFSKVDSGVAIFRCDNMETKIWQEIILPNCTWVWIPKGRIAYTSFEGIREGKGTRFPSALIGFNVEPPLIEGVVMRVNDFKEK